MRNQIIYFFDPICGWCYGFSDHFYAFYRSHKEDYDFRVVTGGMVRGDNARPIGKKAEYLKEAYPRVQELSGATFGEPFLQRLDEGSTVFGSDIPSLVFHSITSKYPDREVEAARAVQRAIYLDGIDPMNLNEYVTMSGQFDFENDEIVSLAESKDVQDKYESDLYSTQQFGIKGFPFVVVQLDGEYYQIARGFRTSEELNEVLTKAIDYHKQR